MFSPKRIFVSLCKTGAPGRKEQSLEFPSFGLNDLDL